MKHLIAVLFFVCGLASAQVNPPTIWSSSRTAPSGACPAGRGIVTIPGGVLYTCRGGTWTQISGGGGSSLAPFTTDGTNVTLPSGTFSVGNTVLDPVSGFIGVYDDFNRADTALGVLGTPNLGSAWELRGGSMAVNPGKTQITSGKWVSAAGDIVYALQTLKARPTTIGGQFSWTSGGGSTNNGAMGIGVSTAYASYQNMLHMVVTPTSWIIQIWKNGSPDHTVGTATFSPALRIDGTSYTFEATIVGSTLTVRPPQGPNVSFVDSDIPTFTGPYVFFEHFYTSATDVISLLRIEKVWATFGLPKLPGLTISDIASFSTVNATASISSGFRTSPSMVSTDRSVGPLRVFSAKVTTGTTGTGTTGTVLFGSTWPVAPACVASDENTPVQPIYTSVSTSQVVVTATSAWGNGDRVDVMCIGM